MALFLFMVKVIIAGGREFNHAGLLSSEVSRILKSNFEDGTKFEVVSGGCRGADKFGEKFAEFRKIKVKRFGKAEEGLSEEEWKGINVNMAKYSDVLIAFWDGKSEGTKHMIDEANSRGLKVFVVIYYMKPLFNSGLQCEYKLAELVEF